MIMAESNHKTGIAVFLDIYEVFHWITNSYLPSKVKFYGIAGFFQSWLAFYVFPHSQNANDRSFSNPQSITSELVLGIV